MSPKAGTKGKVSRCPCESRAPRSHYPWGLYTLVLMYRKDGRRLLIDSNDPGARGVPVNRGIPRYVKFVPAFDAVITYPRLEPVTSGRPREAVTGTVPLTFYTVEPRGAFTRR